MRKFFLFTIIFLAFTSQVFPQDFEFQRFEYPKLPHHYDFSSSSEVEFLLLTRTRQIWNTTNTSWANDSLIEYTYNEQNLVDTIRNHKWISGVWGNDGGYTFVYDPNNGYRLSQLYLYIAQWYNNARYRYLYSGNNLWRRELDFRNGPNWDNVGRATYQHNNQNFVTMITHEYRDMVYGFWCNAYRYEYIYDLDNLLLIATEIDAEGCNGWQLEYQKLYAYDENGNNIEKLGQDWNPSDSTWINDLLYLYEYNSNNALIQTICLAWDPGSLQWENVWQEYYTYTQQDSLETVLKNTWASESKWENYTFRMIAYDNDGNWLEDATQLWDSTNWANYFRYLATWDEPVSAKIDLLIPNNYQLFQNYPNPFNPKTKITYQIPELSFVTLKVYDVLGREVKTLVNEEKPAGNYEVEFDASNLPSGIYFYGIQTSSFRETKKMIILK